MITVINATNANQPISQNAPNAKILITLPLKLVLHVRKVIAKNAVGLVQEIALHAATAIIKTVDHA